MEDLLIETLENFGFPVIRQGSLAPDEKYPDHFFTFWNNSSDGEAFYNNAAHRYAWDFDVNFYSIDPAETYSKLLEAKEELEKVGFIVPGKGYDVASDEPTHTGRGINVLFLETINN